MTVDTHTPVVVKAEARPFQLKRPATVAIGVVVFLFVFRPFGLAMDSVAATLLLLGVAPLNLMIMYGIHFLPYRLKSWRKVVALICLLAGNTAYLVAWSKSATVLEVGISVALVVGLTAGIVTLWDRSSIPEQDLPNRHHHDSARDQAVTLTGQGSHELVRLAPDDILFMSANGNYVDVHYHSGNGVATVMLRSSLARLVSQVPGNRMIRCHRSHFLNLSAARRIVRSKGRTLVEFKQGERVPVSRKFSKSILREITT